MTFSAFLNVAPKNLAIVDTLVKARSVLDGHHRIAVSISGGSDSDIMLDVIEHVKPTGCEIAYVFFNTGLEYSATKRHLDDIEGRYGASIERRAPRKSIPHACHDYGIPFLSKDVSGVLNRLQLHRFDWSETFENATEEKYGRCKSALDWYFDRRPLPANGRKRHSIAQYKRLYEFLRAYPPNFAISDKCCDYAKKYTSADFNREFRPDLVVNGMRRAEGGRRAGRISTCFTFGKTPQPDNYRPLWFWSDADKAEYKAWRGLQYSDCYEVWGFGRTGCVGCPCNSKAEQELALAERFEPNLVCAARGVFGAAYEYRRQYFDFKKMGGEKKKKKES